MSKKVLIYLICGFGALFVVFFTVMLVFRDTIKNYVAIVSSVSTFLYLAFNVIVIILNISNMNLSQKPYVVFAFETLEKGKGNFTLRNIGSVAAIVKSIRIDPVWLEDFFEHTPEITESEKKFMRELKSTHIIVAPNTRVVLKPMIEPQKIIDAQYPNDVKVNVVFTNTYNQKFEKCVSFDFRQYNEMIEYQSDDSKAIGGAIGN